MQNANCKMQIANWTHLQLLERNRSPSIRLYPIRQSGHAPGRFAALGSGGCWLLSGDSGSTWPLAIVSSISLCQKAVGITDRKDDRQRAGAKKAPRIRGPASARL